ncbi:MAG: DegV family protein [Muribaculaceae bacterium]|nr:DegV family protein [Roseburia sp.]MCM1431852.1 DegV family protein [Muribaculaceae bacterium]MCM1493412.1 DegV family protein [Muribaculaceae bacterium]
MYKIVIDSCGELPEDLKGDSHFSHVPLELEVDGVRITDDETFNQSDFLQRVKSCIHSPKSSCPSPERYMQAYEGEEENVYVVTLSGRLSGSYNSAQLGAELYKEEHGEKNIYVFNSRSASIGETLIGLKVQELEEKGLRFDEVVQGTEEYISSMNTFFVLETLETLRKAGRLSNLKALVANTLNIKPVMGSTKEGMIQQLGQARGMKKALTKMVEDMLKVTKNCENRVLAISHCNCPERAEFVKQTIEKLAKFKKIVIVNTAGVSTMYANDGGVILAV